MTVVVYGTRRPLPPPREHRRRPAWPLALAVAALVALALFAVAVLPTHADDGDAPRYDGSARGSRVLSAGQVRAIAADAFGEQAADYATSIAWCESRFDPSADSNWPYVGLWQIDPGLHGWRALRIFGPGASLYDPRVNAVVAADILAEQGWRAWPVCSLRSAGGW